MNVRTIDKTSAILRHDSRADKRLEFANYLSQLDVYRATALRDNAAAIASLKQLTARYPDYPDAFISLGEMHVQAKDQVNAVLYYQRAAVLCPFNDNLAYLLALQCDRVNKLTPEDLTYPDLVLEQRLRSARSELKELQLFKQNYHVKLRQILIPLRLVNTGKLLCEDLDKASDYSDVTLTNGAVVDAFYGAKALQQKQFALAKYYYEKALLRYPHDFISATKLAEIHLLHGEHAQALADCSAIVGRYNYALSYALRANLYSAVNENNLARSDMEKCLSLADKSDMEALRLQQSDCLRLLSIAADISVDIDNNSSNAVKQLQQQISSSHPAAEISRKVILQLDQILSCHPAKVLAYTVRGDAKHKLGETRAALLDYSLALWFAFDAQLAEIYFKRGCVNLFLGEFNAANFDLNNALQAEDQPAEASRLRAAFSGQCLSAGDALLQNGSFYLAEKTYVSGVIHQPSVKLYLQLAVVLGIQHEFDAALAALMKANQLPEATGQLRLDIQKKIKLFSTKQNRLNSLKQYSLAGIALARPKICINHLEADECYQADTAKDLPPIKKLLRQTQQLVKKPLVSATKRPARSTGFIQKLLADDSEIESEQKITEPGTTTVTIATDKNKARNAKIKKRKATIKSLRPTGNCPAANNDSEDAPAANEQPPASAACSASLSLTDNPSTSCDAIALLAPEKLVFHMLQTCKESVASPEAKFYLTGGWALHRARLHYCNIPLPQQMCDIDIVTDLPAAAIEKYCPMFTRIQQVDGLFKGKIGDIHVDIVRRESLKNLFRDAQSRDFWPLYLDDKGNILDPTGFVIAQIKAGVLKSACPVSEVFKRDPLTILRAVYVFTKCNVLMTDLKNQIRIDKKLLVPSLANDLLHPYRFNNLLRKLFSQGLALKNYDKLHELGLLPILFPEISYALVEQRDWMREQMKNTDNFTWPRLEIIYANMLTCAVMSSVNALLPVELEQRLVEINSIMDTSVMLNADGLATIKLAIEDKIINETITKVMRNSLLFQNRFGSLEILQDILTRSIREYKYFQNAKIVRSQESEPAATRAFNHR